MIGKNVRRAMLLVLLAACSGDGGGTGPDPEPGGGGSGGGGAGGGGGGGTTPLTGTVEVHMTAGSFSPANVTIRAGSSIRWVNDVGVTHTITPQNTSQVGVWARTLSSATGTALTHQFSTAGQTYNYRCEPHSSSFTSGMVGTITVVQ